MLSAVIAAAAFQAAVQVAPPPLAAPARQVAHGVYLLPGDLPHDRGPDGNTVVIRSGAGLVVIDTGRHVQHSDAILAFASAQHRPITAIVNTHWHLDHSSGNQRIKAIYPQARLFATNAVDRAMADGGFLATSLAHAQQTLSDPNTDPVQRDETQMFIDTMAHREFLRPDVPVTASRRMRIGVSSFDVHVTNHAVTDADIWLYDNDTRVAVVGDLVTLPAPFFETACPHAWSQALDDVWASPFTLAIPGHGEPMSRAQFNTYRSTFNAFVACVNSDRAASACAADWARGIARLEPSNTRLHQSAAAQAEYYVGFLRQSGGKSPSCQLAS